VFGVWSEVEEGRLHADFDAILQQVRGLRELHAHVGQVLDLQDLVVLENGKKFQIQFVKQDFQNVL
jgi:hypothetical protein